MKQFQFVYQNSGAAARELRHIGEKYQGLVLMFQIFYDNARRDDAARLGELIDDYCPGAQWFGCSSNANIHEGRLEEGTIEAICTVFEDPTAKIKVLQYELDENDQTQLCDELLREVEAAPWVKGIELLMTIRGMSTTAFCDRLSEMREDIEIFGGCAFNKNLDNKDTSVLSKEKGFMDKGAVFVLIGGEALRISTTFITGWRPLGQKFRITKADKNRLYELEGEPAYSLYYRYLRIGNDEHFYHNCLEFPISYERNGISILRVPQDSLPDGSILMTSDMAEGSAAQLSYGDPQTILNSIFGKAKQLADFVPQAITIFDCASRRSFWGSEDIDRESLPFQTLADTAGFYTAGEFHRQGRSLNQHNVTLVIVGMREGEKGVSSKQALLEKYNYDNEHVSMVRRLANFIDVASAELESANSKLGEANDRLKEMAITDELTGILNRRAVKNAIEKASDENASFALVMLDLDNFKSVNDTYGHEEGDRVLIKFAQVMERCARDVCPLAYVGRWGGEEFMICAPGADGEKAFEIAESVRDMFSSIEFPISGLHTVSCGTAVFRPGEDSDEVCLRVDHALYKAKRTGRNRTCREEE